MKIIVHKVNALLTDGRSLFIKDRDDRIKKVCVQIFSPDGYTSGSLVLKEAEVQPYFGESVVEEAEA